MDECLKIGHELQLEFLSISRNCVLPNYSSSHFFSDFF